MRVIATLVLVLCLMLPSIAADRDISINIYNDGFSQVTEKRKVSFDHGKKTIKLTDIAKELDPASIHIDGVGFEVKTVDYQYDLASGNNIYDNYIGNEIAFRKGDSTYSGKLMAYDKKYLYIVDSNRGDGLFIYERDDFKYIQLPAPPAGLVTEPQIVATVDGKARGRKDLHLSYLTDSLSWHTEYHLKYDGKAGADLIAWVNLKNECGVDFPNAEVVLVAGQVEREEATEGSSEQAESGTAVKARKAEMEPLVDYHRYKLPFRVTIGEMENKQALMFSQPGIKVDHYYKYEWSETKSDVKAMISFKNDKNTGLGVPLPAGRMNIFDKETGSFLGSGLFDGTPSGEKAEIYLGTAFDITAERKRIEHKKIGRNKNSDTFEIKIRNHKTQNIMITIAEEIYGYWTITKKSDDLEKKDFQNIEFNLVVKPGQEKVLTYTVEYSY